MINVVLFFLALIWIFSVLFAFMSSFKGRREYNLGNFWDLPQGNSLMDNFKELNQSISITKGIGNSFLYAVLGALFAVAIATLAAYAISHLEIKHKMLWFMFIYSGTIFPFQIYLIPIYRGFSKAGLYDTRLGMVLFYTAICIPFCMFVLRNFFLGISREICESAKVDGAGDFQVLVKIFLPMAKAPDMRTVMSAVSLLGKANVPSLMLACILVSIPTIALFMFLQKNFESGFVYQSK